MSTTMLQLAVSMIFLYLMLSAASSAIQEIIANFFRWRAKTLEKGIAGLFNKEFKDEFYKLPLIESLCSPDTRGALTNRPSYIAPATFALAVLDLAAKKGMSLSGAFVPQPAPPAGNPNNPAAPGGSAPNPPNTAPQVDPFAKPADLLRSLLAGTNTVEEQRKRIETWFNDSMDRVSGWYKRTSNAWLWIIGSALCLMVNADSITLAKTFWNDPTLRAATVAAATQHVKNAPQEEHKPTTPTNPAPTAAAGGGASGQTASSGDTPLKRLNEVRQELTKIDIPLGWCWNNAKGEKKCFPIPSSPLPPTEGASPDSRMVMGLCGNNIFWWLLKFLGLAATALAISQGAPFWFDLLQKAVNLRLAGDAPDEKKQKK